MCGESGAVAEAGGFQNRNKARHGAMLWGLPWPWVSMRPAGCRAAQRKAAATSAAAAEEGKLLGKAVNEPALPVGKDADGVRTGPHTVRARHPFRLLSLRGI